MQRVTLGCDVLRYVYEYYDYAAYYHAARTAQ